MDKLFEIENFQDFERVCHRIIHNLTFNASQQVRPPNNIDQSELKAAEDDVRKLISGSNFDLEKVAEKLNDKAWDGERIKYFLNLLNIEKKKLLYASLNLHNSGYGETITHSDWLLKLVLGTSELNTMKYPLLQLTFSTVDSNGVRSKKLFEINKNVVLMTIESLEQLLLSEAS